MKYTNYSLKQKNYASVSSLMLPRTKWLFLALCCYLLSQSFMIPILAIGPSWALWPNLSDLATGLLVLTFLLKFRQLSPISGANKRIFLILIVALVGSILSYLFYLTWLINDHAPGINIGFYQIYRFVEFICVFWVTAHIPLTPERHHTLGAIADGVLVFVCLGIFLTYFALLPLPVLISHLPQDSDLGGAWSRYDFIGRLGGQGWGTIGYEHSYVAVQVIMLLSLRIHLGQSRKVLTDNIFLFISIIACFLTESRSGLVSILVFAIMYWFQRPIYAAIAVGSAVLIGLTGLIIAPYKVNVQSGALSLIERQGTLLDVGNAENLSGRDDIWMQRLTFLNEKPIRWIFGTGFGTATDSGNKAHMLVFHITSETGLIGLFLFVFLFAHILYYLHRHESGVKAIFLATISFFVSSLSQETLYFTPAFVHFTGFYLCCVAIALQSYGEQKKQQFALNCSE